MFWDLGGATFLQAEMREMHIDSSNVLAVPDPREVGAITRGLSKIDRVLMAWMGFRSDRKFGATNVLN